MNPFTDPWPRIHIQLDWYAADSADTEHHDQDVDLDRLGSPGGASWAAVSHEGDAWDYRVYDRWLYEDAEVLAAGTVPSEGWAKLAVQVWVLRHYPTHTSHDHSPYVWQHRSMS